VFVVKTLADFGQGSLRAALADAGPAGGTIRFAVGGGINLASGLDVPSHTTIDGSTAPRPGITLWGEHAGAGGTGVVNIYDSDVVVRGLRIRNGMNDGVHIVPKYGHPISKIVIDHCSITNNADGGIDITGRSGLGVEDVTVSANYLAGNGGPCPKQMCGGASLVKYRANRVSFYGNFFDKNLRRTPAVSAENAGYEAIADIRYNLVRSPKQGGVQIREGAKANVISNTLQGKKATIAIKLWGGQAYVSGNPTDLGPTGGLPKPLPVPAVPGAKSSATVSADAGAMPRDALDHYYVDTATTFDQVKAKPTPH
jgi:hypothetical protein